MWRPVSVPEAWCHAWAWHIKNLPNRGQVLLPDTRTKGARRNTYPFVLFRAGKDSCGSTCMQHPRKRGCLRGSAFAA